MSGPGRERAECRLAYDLHLQFGRVCSRLGGDAVCGECIRDADAPALGFRRRPVDRGRDELVGEASDSDPPG